MPPYHKLISKSTLVFVPSFMFVSQKERFAHAMYLSSLTIGFIHQEKDEHGTSILIDNYIETVCVCMCV